MKESFDELAEKIELFQSNGLLCETDTPIKYSDVWIKRMKDIKEEEEESSLSNSKIDEQLPKLKKKDFSVESAFKQNEIQEENIKGETIIIFNAVLEKFKGINPYDIYSEFVILFKIKILIIFLIKKYLKKEKFEYLKENKLDIDLELEDLNHSRRIPQDLEDSARNFYNISSDISRVFLDKIMKDFHEPEKNNDVKSKCRMEELKEEDLPDLTLNNYHSSNEFDRLGLRKEKSENCHSNHKN